MGSRSDGDVTPHLNLREYWHETFEQIFQDFSPDEWSLEPTRDGMPQEWQRFKDSAKVKFLCQCGNSWTSMKGIVIFWFKKTDKKNVCMYLFLFNNCDFLLAYLWGTWDG